LALQQCEQWHWAHANGQPLTFQEISALPTPEYFGGRRQSIV
jgi:hypothetical protein